MTNPHQTIPVITIDGSSGVGKGTISLLLARYLGWHYLDSGALYRITAHACVKHHIPLHISHEADVVKIIQKMDIQFINETEIKLEGKNVSTLIRTRECAQNASIVATFPAVRQALLRKQKAFRKTPGLVADGRDMGSVVFTDASVKIFLVASPEERGKRRYKQLKNNSSNDIVSGSAEAAELEQIIAEIKQRDERDRTRSVSPLKPAPDARVIDTDNLSVEAVFQQVLALCHDFLKS